MMSSGCYLCEANVKTTRRKKITEEREREGGKKIRMRPFVYGGKKIAQKRGKLKWQIFAMDYEFCCLSTEKGYASFFANFLNFVFSLSCYLSRLVYVNPRVIGDTISKRAATQSDITL
jgi:hypothetical protein